MTYPETIKYLESFINYERLPFYPYKESFKLERIKEFLKTIDNPQEKLNCIHIAGSKGKGSTCAFIAYILKESGLKVGLYTSPHLFDFRERIRILNQTEAIQNYSLTKDFAGMISEDELIDLTERLKPAIESYNRHCRYGPLSFFEAYTAMALVYFRDKNVNLAVLETGLGGRLDATNVLNPLVCGITPISYEHTQKLGLSLGEIAFEKAGIIKNKDALVVSAKQEEQAQRVIRQRAAEFNARLFEMGRDIFFERIESNPNGQTFRALTMFNEYPQLKIRLLGRHQLINACLALGIIDALRFYNFFIDMHFIREGLVNTLWPGRCEIVAKEPLIMLDGAQNVSSCLALKTAIKEDFQYKKLILILGISKDKDIKGVCDILFAISDEIILTKADNPRAAEPEDIKSHAAGLKHENKLYLASNSSEALALARKKATKTDLILIAGSLFLVGEIRALLTEQITCKASP